MRRSTLYAPRVRGDLDLGLEPTRLAGDGSQKWARIDAPGGLLPGGTPQGIYEQNSTQNYRIGTRRVTDDRVFHYAQAGSTETLFPTYGVCCDATFPESAVVATARAISAYTVTCTSQAAVTADFFAEGWLAVSSGTFGYWPLYRIKSNTADLTGTGTFIVTLYDPLVAPISINDEVVTLFKNKYKGVRSIRSYVVAHQDWPGIENRVCWVGIPLTPTNPTGTGIDDFVITQNYYFWVQTWGPCHGTGVDNYGEGNYEQRLIFYNDGSLKVSTVAQVEQLAGYLLPNTYWGGIGHDLPGAVMLVDLRVSP
ncbi:hypothetical protein ES703_13474 [subsurface metagenome]